MRDFKVFALALTVLLAGCGESTFFGESEGPPLPGERIPILESSRSITPQEQIAGVPVSAPPPEGRADWSQTLGSASHYGGNLVLSDSLQELWQVSSPAGARDTARRPLSPPIVADGRVFVLDAVLNVRAYDADTGAELWAVGTAAEGEHDGFGGGLATDGQRVFMAGGHGQALALEASTGRLFWRTQVSGPVRGAPNLDRGQLHIVTADNRLIALRADDGAQIWDLPGGPAGAAFLGGASPASNGEAVVAALTTGEILAVRAANGREVWRNSLGSLRRFDFGAKLSDIVGAPVLSENVLYAASAAGRMAAFSMRTGNQIWEQRLGSVHSPWVAGDWVYAVSTEAELVALDRRRGFVRWVAPLPRYEDPEDQEGKYLYAGPVMAGGRLIIVRSDGEVMMHAVEDGALLAQWDSGNETILPPIVAGGTLFLLADNGTLTAYR